MPIAPTALPLATRVALLIAAAAAIALLAGCNPEVQGNGVYFEDQRTRDAFEGVHVERGIAVYVTAGENQSIKVIGDANVVPNIATVVLDSEMVGTTKPWCCTSSRRSTTPPRSRRAWSSRSQSSPSCAPWTARAWR